MFTIYINWSANPEIFTIPFINIPLRWYGLIWALAFLSCYKILEWVFKKENKSIELLDKLTLYIIIGTILGARFGHCLFYEFEYYISHPIDILKIYQGGLASHGAALGILIGAILFSVKQKTSLLWLLDKLVMVAPLAACLIRIGNLMNSEIVGKSTTLPWGFKFEKNYEDAYNFINYGIAIPVRHPTQIYEFLFYAALFILFFLNWKYQKINLKAGLTFSIFTFCLFTFRFFIEYLKETQVDSEKIQFFNNGQLLSLPFIIVSIVLFFIIYCSILKPKTHE